MLYTNITSRHVVGRPKLNKEQYQTMYSKQYFWTKIPYYGAVINVLTFPP